MTLIERAKQIIMAAENELNTIMAQVPDTLSEADVLLGVVKATELIHKITAHSNAVNALEAANNGAPKP